MAEETLNSIMEFDHEIRVSVTGEITDSELDFYGTATMYLTDPETGRWELETDMPEGWSLLEGFTGQYSYNGPVMHPSEFIGGGLERHIRETPGHYVAITVGSDCNYTEDGCDEEDGCLCESDGWAVAFKPLTEAEKGKERALEALKAYHKLTFPSGELGEPGDSTVFSEAVADLLTDLRYLVWGGGLDFEALNDQASNRYCEELEAEDDGPYIKGRLEYLRWQIEEERISTAELIELQELAPHIDKGDVLLLQWAGVPEFPEDEEDETD